MPNRLAKETSPYLLQHANNPVDWYAWGPEALDRAEREDKPILLSVGYAACHWCHVMERESFENPLIARVMNQNFVCIKVDREERPDIDDIYMTATIALTGSGGWPMTVFLTPEQAPFFAGTYFPPEDRPGHPGFAGLCQRIAQLWQSDRDQLFRQAGELSDYVRAQSELDPPQTISAQAIERAVLHLTHSFDEDYGGFGPAPKFPPSQALHLLLRHHARTGDKHALEMVTTTLDAMKDGGIYDHLGGGFARYSTDAEWLVPHFEKMLYDNAQLARVYTEAYQVTKDPEYERIVRETLDYVVREMQSPGGGYYSATDADSEGVEGKYFTFVPKELRAILEPEETRAFCAYYDVTEAGNWEDTNVLHVPRGEAAVAKAIGVERDELRRLVASARAKVFEVRQKRVPPLLDDKVLVSWNALMIGAMAEAGRVLCEQRYLDSADRATEYVFVTLRTSDGRLLRTARGDSAHLDAYLEDYAYLADALVDLYEATGNATRLEQAEALCERLSADFLDQGTGSFFQTSHAHEALLVRTRDGNDGALPNANAIAARAFHRLGEHLDSGCHRVIARAAVRAYGQRIERMPRAHLTSLNALDDMLADPVQLVFAGSMKGTQALRAAVAHHYLPNRTIGHAHGEAALAPGGGDEGQPRGLVAYKVPVDGKPALYICRGYTCEKPLVSPSDVSEALRNERDALTGRRSDTLRATRLNGLATPDGTGAYHEQHRTEPSAVHRLGRSGLQVSRVGFGAYRVHRELPDHARAVLLALSQGCNIVDTAPGYTRGSSERAIGDALAELVRKAELTREQVVVVSKLGMVETRPGELPKQATELGPGLGYCLDPAWLEAQLAESLERLNLEALDVCLLHNPELLLQKENRAKSLEQLGAAFEWLEAQVRAGKIGRYGVSSNTLGDGENGAGRTGDQGEAGLRLTLEDLVQLVQTRGLEHFAVIELPLNPLESAALTSGVVQRASELGWGVLINRPLNALVDDELWRLADAPEHGEAPALENVLSNLAALEGEFRERWGAVIEAVPDAGLDPAELLNWSGRIGERELSSRALWNEFERGILAPELSRVLGGLDRVLAGKQVGQVWGPFKKRYTEQLEAAVLAARHTASLASNRRNAPFARALRAHLKDVEEPRDGSLAQLVVWTLGSLPGVSSVLVGMRDPDYARDFTQTLQWEVAHDPEGAIAAVSTLA